LCDVATVVLKPRSFTRYNQLLNRFSKRFDNRLNVCIHDTAGCQTGTGLTTPVWQRCWTNSCSFNRLANRVDNRFDNRLYTRYSRLSKRFDNRIDNRLCRV